MRKTPINTKELKFESQDGKTSPCKPIMHPSKRRKVLLLGQQKKGGKKEKQAKTNFKKYFYPFSLN